MRKSILQTPSEKIQLTVSPSGTSQSFQIKLNPLLKRQLREHQASRVSTHAHAYRSPKVSLDSAKASAKQNTGPQTHHNQLWEGLSKQVKAHTDTLLKLRQSETVI